MIGNSRSDKKKDKERKSNLSNTFSKSFLITFISDCGKIFFLSFINGEVGVCCISDMMILYVESFSKKKYLQLMGTSYYLFTKLNSNLRRGLGASINTVVT